MCSFLATTLCFFPACASKTEPEFIVSSEEKVYNPSDLDQQPGIRSMKTPPVYPIAMKRQGISGEVLLEFVVDARGNVHDVTVVKSTHKEFEQPAIDAISQAKFSPGKIHGKAVSALVQKYPISFNLSDDN